MTRILFLYARLNPGVMYVQGMNEILATLYFCFCGGRDDGSSFITQFIQYFESDLFFCFTKVMSDLIDGFMRTMDSEESGINGRIRKFSNLFNIIDTRLFTHLDQN